MKIYKCTTEHCNHGCIVHTESIYPPFECLYAVNAKAKWVRLCVPEEKPSTVGRVVFVCPLCKEKNTFKTEGIAVIQTDQRCTNCRQQIRVKVE